VIDSIYQHLDNHEYTIGIYLDLQKAFDTVNHDILLYKLSNYGIGGVVYQWFKKYLSDRKQFISVAGVSSEIGSISMGVSQGSVLGPLLFLLYVNDIHKAVLDAKVKLFADYTNLFLYGKNLCTLFDRANACLQHMFKWFIANRLNFNVDKTCFVLSVMTEKNHHDFQLKVNGKNISRVDSCKYLGVIIDSNLSWKEHSDYVCKST